MDKRLSMMQLSKVTLALSYLLQQDPYLIDRTHLNCEDKNVLHISAMLGHEEFLKAILQVNSSFSYHMCLARDRDGRNPMHLAAIHGQSNILNLMNEFDGLMHAAIERDEKGDNILHLCVKYNQLESLKLLLQIFADPELEGAKNQDGMTILHLAFHYGRLKTREQIIIHLINTTPGIINVRNANGHTALDLLLALSKISPQGEVAREIKQSLVNRGAVTGTAINTIENPEDPQLFLEKSKDVIMVVSSLIATMAFQAAISPPGGVWQDDLLDGPKPHRAGEPVMLQTHPYYYVLFAFFNNAAFWSSLTPILMLMGRGVTATASLPYPPLKLSTLIAFMFFSITGAYGIAFVILSTEVNSVSDIGSSFLVLFTGLSLPLISILYEKYKSS